MKRHLLCLIALAAPLHAAPLNPAQIPGAAQWHVHADLDALRASETGKMIFSRLDAVYGLKLKAAKRMFSIDPATDLKGITLYGNDLSDKSVILIHGNFDRAHLEDIVAALPGYETGEHNGITTHSWRKKASREECAAFAAEDLVVYSRSKVALLQALNVIGGKAPAMDRPAFAGESGASLLSAEARLSGIPLYGDSSRILRLARTLSMAANEQEGRFVLRVAAESPDAASADRLRRLLDGMIAFLEVGDEKFEGLDLRSSVTVPPDKPGVLATASLPVAEWLSLAAKKAASMERKNSLRKQLRNKELRYKTK